jgi:hypothetical protein
MSDGPPDAEGGIQRHPADRPALGSHHPEAIRTVAQRDNLPVDRISRVRVFDPYVYR